MKNNRSIITVALIVLLTAVCLLIDLPAKLPIDISWGKLQIHQTLQRPPLDLTRFGIPFQRDLELHMGLDIQGGTRIVLQADMSGVDASRRDEALDSARGVIARRVDLYGVSESVVQTSKLNGQYRIIAEMPGVTNTEQAIALIGSTAQLDFREMGSPSATPAPVVKGKIASAAATPQNPFDVFKPTGLTGKDLTRATVEFSQQTGQPVVSLQFNDAGKKKFADITTRNVGKPVGIFLDNQPITIPNVNEPILTGTAQISGSFSTDQAKELSIQLNAGALPVPITIVQQDTVDASLGQGAVAKTAYAGLIGVALVMIFMISYYGWKGFLADVALVIYGIITLALYKLLPVTLTVPGIAGLLLSIGMAVDSNILIFERMKEELRLGKPFELAMHLGFGRAWNSIKDANVATLFTSFILFNPLELEFLNRSGLVRGFAFTLALGIFVSLFTGIIVTRTLLRMFLQPEKTEGKND
ncbi:MAG TPA: protein translocase subunit SecD [Candidatus Saccharimonadia bacterium]|nr:protein translocase subunit SecD [Candidatus Saccharimonadia bacterium]